MRFWVPTGQFNSEDAVQDSAKNAKLVERDCRESPQNVKNHTIGHILPLGQIDSTDDDFDSKFIVIAYEIANEFGTSINDFSEINLYTREMQDVTVISLENSLNQLIEATLGKGWRVAIFNDQFKSALDFLQKGQQDISSFQQASKNIVDTVHKQIANLKKSTKEKPYKHDIIDLFYADCDTLDAKFCKLHQINQDDQRDTSNKVQIEVMVYDRYANGIRLLSNYESFTSARIRQHSQDNDKVWAFVLKARISVDQPDYLPIRQFNGSTTVSSKQNIQGTCKRIVYTLVNKNYNRWNFISIPTGDKHTYQII